jgi:hypothetical protein
MKPRQTINFGSEFPDVNAVADGSLFVDTSSSGNKIFQLNQKIQTWKQIEGLTIELVDRKDSLFQES